MRSYLRNKYCIMHISANPHRAAERIGRDRYPQSLTNKPGKILSPPVQAVWLDVPDLPQEVQSIGTAGSLNDCVFH